MGYSTTHVANGYFEPIYVKVEQGKPSFDYNVIIGDASVCAKETYDKLISVGFSKVFPRVSFSASPGEDKYVYISVWCPSRKFIWDSLEQKKDTSFIVTLQGDIIRSKYGESIWVDENGRNHKPSQSAVDAAAEASQTCSSGTLNRFVKTYSWAVQMCVTVFLLVQFC